MSQITRRLRVLDDQDDSTLLKVAFATSDRVNVDQHFGSAAFAIYGVNMDEARLFNVVEFSALAQDGNEVSSLRASELLEGCIAVYAAPAALGP